MSSYSYKDGRIWVQFKKFNEYTLFLPYGLTDFNDPTGTLNPVREPHPSRRRSSVVDDILRSEPGLPGFTLESRFKQSLNYLLGMRDKIVNVQVHLGSCGNADAYNDAIVGLGWDYVQRGDLGGDRAAQIEGDDSMIAMTAPFMAKVGPTFVDFRARFLSARTISEAQDITGIASLIDECNDLSTQHDPGDITYVSTKALSGSPVNVANVWYTIDAGENWAEVNNGSGVAQRPFAAAVDISDIAIQGQRYNHTLLVSNGTAAGGSPASVARAIVQEDGVVAWSTYNVGSVNGQYITRLLWFNYSNVFALTNDGYVYKSKNGGVTWEAKLTTAVEPLYGISANLKGDVWVSGDNGTLYHSTNRGDTWTDVTPHADAVSADSRAVAVSPDGTAFVGFGAVMYGSFNLGKSWSILPMDVTPTVIQSIKAYNDTHIWAAVDTALPSVGRVLRSTDGGNEFKLWELNLPENSGLTSLSVINQNYVFVAGLAHEGSGFITKTQSDGVGVITA